MAASINTNEQMIKRINDVLSSKSDAVINIVNEMKAFFKELYDFVRTAEISCETIDDCSHEVTFIYGPLHREIFEGATIKGHEDLIHKITSFINAHRGRADE